INGETHSLWRAVDHEGEVLESNVTKHRDRKAALKFKTSMKRHGRPHTLVSDKLRSYGAVMKVIGNADRQETGRWENNRAENAHPLPDSGLLAKHEKGPFRRRERAMQRFRSMRCLKKLAAVHAAVYTHFNQECALYTRANFKANRAATLAEWCGPCAA
uniref:DDE-type integrase/transposase/recombinase n=1 Tax=uncultured Boseongicola sp. TaxID=1648499 RepID=UPI00261F644A